MNDAEATLQPCPFCGGEAFVDEKHPVLPNGALDDWYRAQCMRLRCGARTSWWYPREAAVQAWNRRTK